MKITWTPSGGGAETLCDHTDSISDFGNAPQYGGHSVVAIIGAESPNLHDRGNRLDVIAFTAHREAASLEDAKREVLATPGRIGGLGELLFEPDGAGEEPEPELQMSPALLRIQSINMRGVMVSTSYEAKGKIEDVPEPEEE